MGDVLEFRVFGAPEVRRGPDVLAMGHARQLSVLTVLLVEANRLVTVDQLLARVWGENLPHRSRSALYSYLSRLRHALGDGAGIVSRLGGYVLEADPATIDLHRFRDLVSAGEPGRALELVRGEPFAGLTSEWFDAQRETVRREVIAAELDHTDARLAAGEHGALVAELTELTTARPLDERLAGQLMRALHGSERQAEALAHYEQLRRTLADELGIDPCPALRELHAQLIAGPQQTNVPRQLPAAPPRFTGREAELAALHEPAGVVAITGNGGIGKTWFALRWAHLHAGDFPDGQLFADLRGFAPDSEPVAAETVLSGFLSALGVAANAIPPEQHAQTALYRTLLADRRMLIVLDNAADTAQVVPLLPGGSGCCVVITSRDRLPGLVTAHGARPVPLDVLDDATSWRLLEARLGPARLRAEEPAARELLAHCGGFPLAIAIVAGRALAFPELPLAGLAASLRDERSRLGTLDDGDPAASLPATLSWSIAALAPEHATAFALLGLPDGPDLSLTAATSLFGRGARETLRALERVSLLHQHVPGRWRMHDLVALYAAERAALLTPDERTRALRRLLDFYAQTSWGAEARLSPRPVQLAQPAPEPGTEPLTFEAESAALAWLIEEHENMQAAQRLAARLGWSDLVWALAKNRMQLFSRRGLMTDSVETWETALAASDGRPRDEVAFLHRRLGHSFGLLHELDRALSHLDRALALSVGDNRSIAHAQRVFGVVWEHHGDPQRALAHAREALRIAKESRDALGYRDSLNQVSAYLVMAGEYREARDLAVRALPLHRAAEDPWSTGDVLDSLARIACHTGDLAEAIAHFEEALALYLQEGNLVLAAQTHAALGDVLADAGEPTRAREQWQQALDHYLAQHRVVEAEAVRLKLVP